MKMFVLLLANAGLLGLFLYLLFRKDGLSYYRDGRIWLTWLAVAVITLMDELTSVFYAPAEAYRFIGPSAIVFIAFTAGFIHYMTTRLVEIAEILEHHKIFGGGVYSFLISGARSYGFIYRCILDNGRLHIDCLPFRS